jgi:outer membrane murein-binding lipoprotein Lpp
LWIATGFPAKTRFKNSGIFWNKNPIKPFLAMSSSSRFPKEELSSPTTPRTRANVDHLAQMSQGKPKPPMSKLPIASPRTSLPSTPRSTERSGASTERRSYAPPSPLVLRDEDGFFTSMTIRRGSDKPPILTEEELKSLLHFEPILPSSNSTHEQNGDAHFDDNDSDSNKHWHLPLALDALTLREQFETLVSRLSDALEVPKDYSFGKKIGPHAKLELRMLVSKIAEKAEDLKESKQQPSMNGFPQASHSTPTSPLPALRFATEETKVTPLPQSSTVDPAISNGDSVYVPQALLSQLTQQVTDLQGQFAQIELELEKQNQRVDVLSQQKVQAEQSVSILSNKLSHSNINLQKIEFENHELKQEIATLKGKQHHQLNFVAEALTQSSDSFLQGELSELKAALEETEKSLELEKSKISVLETTIEEKETQLNSTAFNAQHDREKIDQQAHQISRLQAQVFELEQAQQLAANEVGSLRSRASSLHAEELKHTLDLQRQIEELKDENLRIAKEEADLRQQLDDVEFKAEEACRDEIQKLHGQITQLLERVALSNDEKDHLTKELQETQRSLKEALQTAEEALELDLTVPVEELRAQLEKERKEKESQDAKWKSNKKQLSKLILEGKFREGTLRRIDQLLE